MAPDSGTRNREPADGQQPNAGEVIEEFRRLTDVNEQIMRKAARKVPGKRGSQTTS